jgi:hypothetical protein
MTAFVQVSANGDYDLTTHCDGRRLIMRADRASAIGDRKDEARDVRSALRAQPAPAPIRWSCSSRSWLRQPERMTPRPRGRASRTGLHAAPGDAAQFSGRSAAPADCSRRAKVKTRTGRLWTYVRDDRPFGVRAPPAAVFFYSADGAGIHAERHLARYAGVLQSRVWAAARYAGAGNRAQTLKTRTGRCRPFSVSSPANSVLMLDSTAECTLPSMRI